MIESLLAGFILGLILGYVIGKTRNPKPGTYCRWCQGFHHE